MTTDPEPRVPTAETAELVVSLEERGLLDAYLTDEGGETYRLSDEGIRVGRTLAKDEGEDAQALVEALLLDP
jgi:hypothetical protein